MVVDGQMALCSRKGCNAPSKGASRYCSDTCRAKASHARRYIKRKPRSVAPLTVQRRALQLAAEWLQARLG